MIPSQNIQFLSNFKRQCHNSSIFRRKLYCLVWCACSNGRTLDFKGLGPGFESWCIRVWGTLILHLTAQHPVRRSEDPGCQEATLNKPINPTSIVYSKHPKNNILILAILSLALWRQR